MPGLGLAVWPDAPADPGAVFGACIAVPDSLVDLLGARRLRHAVESSGTDGTRQFHPATGLGVPRAVELLDRCEHLSVGGDVAYYRHLLAGVRAYIESGAVAPSTRLVGGEYEVRWVPVPTGPWQSWLTVANASAPPALSSGVGAVTDFVAEVIDHECRRLLSRAGVSSAVPLIAGLADRSPTLLTVETGPRSVQAWQDWVGTAASDTTAVVLRLHAPDDDPEQPPPPPDQVRWRLEVCLRTPSGELSPAVPHRLDPHDLDAVTTELARATIAFGELSRAEADPHSLDFLLTTTVVDQLLGGGVDDLQTAGINVLLPSAIAAVTPSLSLRSQQTPGGGSRPGFVGLDEISDFEWRLALGDVAGARDLSQSDLDELAQQSGDLVRLRGKWLRAEGAALHRAAAFVAAQRAVRSDDKRPTMAQLLALVTDPDTVPVPVAEVSGLGWLDDIARDGVFVPPALPAPTLLRAELRPYQQRGLEWLSALGGIGAGGVLADDMGLGKTVQVIALLTATREQSGREQPGAALPALVVCPMSVIGNWSRELATFAPHLAVLVHHGAGRSVERISTEAPDVVLTTFATLARDRPALAALRWGELVVDEAQHVKNVHTAAAKALRAIASRQRIALTGTPVENRLEDLRAVLDLVNPGMLGTASAFRARFAEPIERDRDPRAVARLSSVTKPFILRREKTDPLIAPDLPEKTELLVRTNLSSEQAGLYQAVLNELNEALADTGQGGPRRRTVLAALTRLKQICNHPAHYLDDGSAMQRRGRHRSGKVELLVDILTTVIAEGERALVFTQFAAFAELLSEWLQPVLGTPVPLLHGGSSREQRDAMVAGFAEPDGPPVLLATLKAGGTGLNLVAANHVIHADRWWNPAVEDQATDRAYRIGQQRNVQVRKFVCVGTLEERIDEMITSKRELSKLTVSTGESWLTDLDDDTLMDLLALRDEAVGE